MAEGVRQANGTMVSRMDVNDVARAVVYGQSHA